MAKPIVVPVASEFPYARVRDNLQRRPNFFADQVQKALVQATHRRGDIADVYIRETLRGWVGKNPRGLMTTLGSAARKLQFACSRLRGFKPLRIVRIEVPTGVGQVGVVAVRFERRLACIAMLIGAACCYEAGGITGPLR